MFHLPLAASVITVSGGCTLVDAIKAANTDISTGSCPAGSGADRIVLTGDVTLTSVDNMTDGANGLPSIVSEITIQGEGRTVSRSSPSQFRIFHVASPGKLTLLDTAVSGGSVPGAGGGLFNRGYLALVHSTVSGNQTTSSASTQYAEGGGVYNAGGTVTMTNTFMEDNLALGVYAGGAAIHNYGGSVALTNTTLSRNLAIGASESYGGGIYNASGELTLKNTTLYANRAGSSGGGYGGALFNTNGTVILTNSTLSMNTASVSGVGYGGGIYNASGVVSLVNSTLYGNSVAPSGSGYAEALYNAGGATMTLTNSIVDTAAYGVGDNCLGTIGDGGENLGSDDSCPRVASITGYGIIPADNGGPVSTHAVYAGSNAIDRDTPCDLPIDARETLRDGACDTGAFEFGADDPFEPSGGLGTDDSCPGHHFLIGKTERHLHVEDAEDWIRFEAKGGATYEIRTSNLIWNSDTELELSENCGPPVATDKDGGEGSASLITYTPAGDTHLDVRIRDEVGSSTQKGYDVEVICTANCPACALPGGDSFDLATETIFSYRRIEACSEVKVTGATTIRSGAKAILRAGTRLVVHNGFIVEKDSRLVLASDPNLLSAP